MIISALKLAQKVSGHELSSVIGTPFLTWANGAPLEDSQHIFSAPLKTEVKLSKCPRTVYTVTKIDNKQWQVTSIKHC